MSDTSPGRPRRVQPPKPRTATSSRRTSSRSASARRSTTSTRPKTSARSGRTSVPRTGRAAARKGTTARRRPKGTVHGKDYLLLAAGVGLVIAATAMGTWATFAWLFVNLGFDRGTIMPLAILAVISAGGGVWLLVWIQRVPPFRFIGFILAFAGFGLILVAAGLAFLRRDWGPAVLLAGILIAAGLGILLYSAQQSSRRRR
jgi:hypothetical protein